MSATVAVAATRPAPPALAGWLWGLGAAAIWGSYMAFARLGVTGGLAPLDFSLLRYGSAGLLLFPLLAQRGLGTLGGVGWRRGLVLAALAGPPFIVAATAGFLWSPLAHGAVLQPGTVTIAAVALAALFLNERVAPLRWAGAGVVLAGLALVSGIGAAGGGGTWRGDLCFVAAGLLWSAFTVASRRWRVDPLVGTAIVCVLGGAAAVPLWLALGDPAALLAQGWRTLLAQIVVQGPLSGIGAVYCFARAVVVLGAGRAAQFPALVPVVAVLLGVPIVGEWPTAEQALGIAVVMAGMPLALAGRGTRR